MDEQTAGCLTGMALMFFLFGVFIGICLAYQFMPREEILYTPSRGVGRGIEVNYQIGLAPRPPDERLRE